MITFPFLASFVRLGTARGPRLAVVWHMAEGGGTSGYLSRENPNGVSVHYVVEYSGRIVQMLSIGEMHSSIRTSAIRMSDDADGFYGRSAAKAAMGAWADTRLTGGPNHASIGVEIEGFASVGPNDAQKAAIRRLYLNLLGRFPSITSLGHRDFADYKACPGRKFPWELVGGHAQVTQEEPPVEGLTTVPASTLEAGIARLAEGTEVIRVADRARIKVSQNAVRSAVGPFTAVDLDATGYLVAIGGATCWVRASAANFDEISPAVIAPESYPVTVGGRVVGTVMLP